MVLSVLEQLCVAILLAHLSLSSMDLYTLQGFANTCSDRTTFTQGSTIPILMHAASALVQTPRVTEWNFATKPVPTSAEILTVCDTGCSPLCCLTDNCKHHVNTVGMLLKNIENYLVVVGGVKVNGLPNLKPDCFYQKDASGCLAAATNEVYMIREDGKFFWVKTPDGTPKPPRVFGHRVALFLELPRVWLYLFGGRSPDFPNMINSEVWRFEVPYSSMAHVPNAGVWEKVDITGNCDLRRTGGSLVIVNNIFYYYGGLDVNMESTQTIFKINPVTKICTVVSWSSPAKNFNQKLWDGTTASYSIESFKFTGRMGALMKYENDVFVVIDGSTLEKGEIRPINQIVFLAPNTPDNLTITEVKFGDELYRTPKKTFPFCVVAYSSNVPQMHFVGYVIEGSDHLEVKHILIDPTKPGTNTYNEILTFGGRSWLTETVFLKPIAPPAR